MRTDRSRVNEFDAYGYRPLVHPWKLLSACEFLQQRRCELPLIPKHYSDRNQPARTKWTKQGEQLVKSHQYKAGKVTAKPGEHYEAVEPESDDEYFLFPQDAGAFCHSWALVRKPRPHVVVIEGMAMPSVNRTSVYNAQYCSLFFRPWTLYRGDSTVPHLSLLGMEAAQLEEWHESLGQPSTAQAPSRLTKKTAKKRPESVLEKVSWKNAWDEYVRGNVVSDAAARLIQSFLLNTMASSGKAADDVQSDADATEDEAELPPLKLPCRKFQELLQAAGDCETLGEKWKASAKAKAKAAEGTSGKKSTRLQEYEQSHRIGERVWKTGPSGVEAGERACPGHMFEDSCK